MPKRYAIAPIIGIAVLLASCSSVPAGGLIGPEKAKEIGCAAIRDRYPNDGYRCADLEVVLMRKHSKWEGHWNVTKKDTGERLRGTPSAIISSRTGELLNLGYYAS